MNTGPVRRSVAIPAAVILFLLVAFSMLRIYLNSRLEAAAARFRKEAGPLEVTAYSPPLVPEMQNVARWLNAGAGAFIVSTEERTECATQLLSSPSDQWNQNVKLKVQAALSRNEPALTILRRALDFEDSSFQLSYNLGSRMELPELFSFLQAQKFIACKARIHLSEGNIPEAFHAAAIEERMAAALSHEPVVIINLIGHVVEKDYYELLQQMIPFADRKLLDEFAAQMGHLRRNSASVKQVLAAEGATLYHEVQQFGYPEELRTDSDDTLLRLVSRLDRRLFLANILEVYSSLVREASVPIGRRQNKSIDGEFSYTQKMLKNAFFPYPLETIERFQATFSARILASTAVDLCRTRIKNGEYPRHLPEQLRISSPYSGEVVAYNVLSDGSATLAFPEAEKLWAARRKDAPEPRKPRFHWKLPAKFSPGE